MKTNLSRLAEKLNLGNDSTQPPDWWLNGLTAKLRHANPHLNWLERAVGARRYRVPALPVASAIVAEHLADRGMHRLMLQD